MSLYLKILLFVLMTFLGALGSLLLKMSTKGTMSPMKVIFHPCFIFGGLFYFLSAVINIIILKHVKYSIFLPLTSVTYIWSMLLAYFVLKEKISKEKIFGIVSILVGTFLLVYE